MNGKDARSDVVKMLENINLYTIKTDRFKTCHVEIIFRNNVVPEELTIRNVLFDTLLESNKEYFTKEEYNYILGSLYTKIGVSVKLVARKLNIEL